MLNPAAASLHFFHGSSLSHSPLPTTRSRPHTLVPISHTKPQLNPTQHVPSRTPARIIMPTLPPPSKTILTLQTKISRVRNSIAYVSAELASTLDKLSALSPMQDVDDADLVSSTTTTTTTSQSLSTSTQVHLTPAQLQTLAYAQRVLGGHVKQLQRYNEMKDVAMSLVGIVADSKGESVGNLLRERGWEGEE